MRGRPPAGGLGGSCVSHCIASQASRALLGLGRLCLVDIAGLALRVVVRQLQGGPLDVQLAPARSAG